MDVDDNTLDTDSPGQIVLSRHCLILKQTLLPGTLGIKPRENSMCTVDITDVTAEGLNVDPTSLPESVSKYLRADFKGIVSIGFGDTFIDKGLETCIQTMHEREKSKFTLKFPLHTSSTPLKDHLTYATVVKCTLFMENLVQSGVICLWSDTQLYQLAKHHKTRGVDLFKNGRTLDAFLRFNKALKFLYIIDKSAACPKPTVHDIKHLEVTLINNMALCQFKFGNFIYVVTLCTKVLNIDPKNEKALYRRAMALSELRVYDDAEADLLMLTHLKPGSKIVKEKYKESLAKLKEMNEKYAAVIKKMFS